MLLRKSKRENLYHKKIEKYENQSYWDPLGGCRIDHAY